MGPDPNVGRLLGGRYRIGRRLGRGGMSDVYEARDPVLGREVAVKLVDAARLGPEGVDRLEQEARRLASLSHPNLVVVHDAVRDGDTAAIVMERIEGGTLADRLAGGPLDPDEAVAIASAVARGLDAAHARGLVHRDVKPSNVLLDGDVVKVTDFGIAGRTTRSDATTTVHGSLPYVAPEQVDGAPTDARTDVYALGCVLYELLTGRPPFAGDSNGAVAGQHLHAAPAPPSSRIGGLPPALDTVVLRMLAKDAADRPQTMAAVVDELDRARHGDATKRLPAVAVPTRVVADTSSRPPRWRWLLAAAAVAAAVLVAVGLWAGWGRGTDDRPEAVADEPTADAPTTPPAPTEPTPATTTAEPTSPAEPTSVEAAAERFREQLAEGRAAGEMSRKAEEELDKRVTEVLKAHREDKPEDVRNRVQELRKQIRELADKGELADERADVLDATARDVLRLAGG